MTFFGITFLGYQDPFGSRRLSQLQKTQYDQEGDGVGGRQRGTTLPPVNPAPHQALSCELHRGSQERYQELVRRAQTPRSPNQIYRAPLTDSQRYGWWLSGSGQPGSEGSEPWTRVRRFPQRHSEMTKFVKSMSMTHREFSLH
ncbi:sperm microtubule inner protein 11 [Lepisosteus oculatus]|uniref:Sperm microtubule inner protein 11 n=1 Tax=Lepisosteus oculatus TaxID=7918 RepID=W5MKZ2_LEPOC